ncbi:MAG: hypothetical protein NUV63_12265 [Gallionella sp.]|nr:hypothetical protein [Gallionella sp.]
MNIDEQDRIMAEGFGAALALTEEAVNESLEQRVARIRDDILRDYYLMHSVGECMDEFARRLTAEQQKSEPVAEVLYAGILDAQQRRLQFIVVKEQLPDHMKLYAATPQDGMVPREPTEAEAMAIYGALQSSGTEGWKYLATHQREKYVRAAKAMIDAAMQEGKS